MGQVDDVCVGGCTECFEVLYNISILDILKRKKKLSGLENENKFYYL